MAIQKKTLPNGQQVYTYDVKDRKRGKTWLTIAVIIVILSLLARLAQH